MNSYWHYRWLGFLKKKILSHLEFTNLIVLGESVIVKDSENQCLVKGFTIRYLKNYDRCFSVNYVIV